MGLKPRTFERRVAIEGAILFKDYTSKVLEELLPLQLLCVLHNYFVMQGVLNHPIDCAIEITSILLLLAGVQNSLN